VSQIPREARDGLMRAWLEILRERHPGTAWVVADQGKHEAAPAPVIGREPASADAVSAAAA
jgi:hypothetical protein